MLERVGNPVRIIADTTRKCNLNCWYCHSTSGPFYKGPELNDKDIRNIYEASEKAKVFDITLTGGEPTLWKGLDDAMDASKDLNHAALQLITNATVLSESRLQTLKRGRLSRILVSLDGVKETHDLNRGENSFDRTIKGIQALRGVVDNITVISVIDNSNFDKWPELTRVLIDMGIKQHHLSPVCFAGGAMKTYKGLTDEQFTLVRKTVDQIAPNLPDDFDLVFNDILINRCETRSLSTNLFGERYKGWHFVVRPDGKVNIAVRAWGRSWRENETLGNLKEEPLTRIMDRTAELRRVIVDERFDAEEEKGRKFHLNNPSTLQIELDRSDVKLVESGSTKSIYEGLPEPLRNEANYEEAFYLNLKNSPKRIAGMLASDPERYRLRNEDGFGFLFDRQSFNITMLRQDELDEINQNLPDKHI